MARLAMKRVVVDASALAAVIFTEPGSEILDARLESAEVFAPAILQFELANVAWKKIRKNPAAGVVILSALRGALDDGGIEWIDINPTDVVLIAQATGLTPYDASYLWLAGTLGADLVTLDKRLSAASAVTT
jgi:predicted nucleic acid-binding protein